MGSGKRSLECDSSRARTLEVDRLALFALAGSVTALKLHNPVGKHETQDWPNGIIQASSASPRLVKTASSTVMTRNCHMLLMRTS